MTETAALWGRSQWDGLRPLIVGTLALMWPLLGVLFLMRRIGGQLEPLPASALVGAALVLASIAAVMHRSGIARWSSFFPGITLAIFALALSIPGTHPAALGLFWLILIGEEVASQRLLTKRVRRDPTAIPPVSIAAEVDEEIEEASLLPPGTSQQITRTRDEAGQELLSCLLRVSFAAGEQTQTLHVAFCPALEGMLEATNTHREGAPCEIKVSQLESFGARLDVKRRGALQLADEAIIELQVIASAAT